MTVRSVPTPGPINAIRAHMTAANEAHALCLTTENLDIAEGHYATYITQIRKVMCVLEDLDRSGALDLCAAALAAAARKSPAEAHV